MKEYLKKNEDGSYELIKCTAHKEGWIKVPNDSMFYYYFPVNKEYAFSKNYLNYVGIELLWEREKSSVTTIFKQYKFKSDKPSEIVIAVNILERIGYKKPEDFFDLAEAVEGGGICTWDGGFITEGYLYFETDHEDITLEKLKIMVCEASSPNVKTTVSGNYTLREQYKHLIGVQFNKTIYPFNDQRYVHNVGRDKDGDFCVVDQYDLSYKLRDVEFYVSDEHDDTMTYQQYSKFVSI